MSSVLNEICARKREHVAQRKRAVSLEELQEQAAAQPAPRGFIKRIRSVSASGIALITEVKKASPSKGVIREDFDALTIAQAYEQSGAACISVLTDEPYFQGADAYLRAIRGGVSLPLLRKDFMVDPYQIHESRALGADCILLIMAALEDSQAADLHALSHDLGMDVLVEIHNEEELDRALALNPQMIGVNNRNLKTLAVDVQTSFDLAEKIPPAICAIAESGLGDTDTLNRLIDSGYSGFLVGESLMRQPDIAAAVTTLRGQ